MNPEPVLTAVADALAPYHAHVAAVVAAFDSRKAAEAGKDQLAADVAEADGLLMFAGAKARDAKAAFAKDPSPEAYAAVERSQVDYRVAQAKHPETQAGYRPQRERLQLAAMDAKNELAKRLQAVVKHLHRDYTGPGFELLGGDTQLVLPARRGVVSNVMPEPPTELQARSAENGFVVRLGDVPTLTVAELVDALRPLLSAAVEAAE
jgi:hypothetical protein